jgi:hypothetical protein
MHHSSHLPSSIKCLTNRNRYLYYLKNMQKHVKKEQKITFFAKRIPSTDRREPPQVPSSYIEPPALPEISSPATAFPIR